MHRLVLDLAIKLKNRISERALENLPEDECQACKTILSPPTCDQYSHDFFVKMTNMAKILSDFNILANVERQKVDIGTNFQRRFSIFLLHFPLKFFHGIVWHTLFYS